mgnify:CR=1 FL=1
MTTYATFIINGCERVIVSQIIRSPGIYFEKTKNQKKLKSIKKKLSTQINKVQSFIPLGESFVLEQTLSFLVNPFNQTFYQYSLNNLKKIENPIYFYFLESFKIYKIIFTVIKKDQKFETIKLFLHWFNLHTKFFNKTSFRGNQSKLLLSLIENWNIILKSLVKYQFLTNILQDSSNSLNTNWIDKVHKKYSNRLIPKSYLKSKNKILNLIKSYKKIIELIFIDRFFLLLINKRQSTNNLTIFKFLNKNFDSLTDNLNDQIYQIKNDKLKANIYFSNNLKELTNYKQKKKLKYLSSRSEIIVYKDFYDVQNNYSENFVKKITIRLF